MHLITEDLINKYQSQQWKYVSNLRDSKKLTEASSNHKSAPSLLWCSWVFYKWRFNIFNLPRNESWKLMGKSSRLYATTLPWLLGINIVVAEIQWFYYVAWSSKTTWLKAYVTWELSKASRKCAKFGSHRDYDKGEKNFSLWLSFLRPHNEKVKSPSCQDWWPYIL